jgi:hypothetical protein
MMARRRNEFDRELILYFVSSEKQKDCAIFRKVLIRSDIYGFEDGWFFRSEFKCVSEMVFETDAKLEDIPVLVPSSAITQTCCSRYQGIACSAISICA